MTQLAANTPVAATGDFFGAEAQHKVSPTPVGQLTIDHAIAAGQHGMAISLESAEKADPQFRAKAEAAILAHLRTVGQCSGEVLTDVAKAHGARPKDDRAFGSVYQSLARRGLIRCVGFCVRTKGHATAGGRIWAAAHA